MERAEGTELYEYRAGWKEGAYSYWSREPSVVAVTLTTRHEVHTAEAYRALVSRAMDSAGCDGLVLVEEGRGDGRLHAHGLLVAGVEAEDLIGEWQHKYGYVVTKITTDLMGWITYMFKSFGPETAWTWRKEGKHAESGKIQGAVLRASETETPEESQATLGFEEVSEADSDKEAR